MEKVCKSCGTTLSQFYKTSMLGCADCYRTFSVELIPILKKMHGKTSHIGKSPKVSDVDREMLFEYRNLLKNKEQALLDGNFDSASQIDEELIQLKYELARRGLIK